MTEHADLIAACVADPDDDEPRLVWADAVGGERGEFVVLQCALARGVSPPESGWMRRRQRELLARHGAEWSGLRGLARRARFRRGFVEAIEVELDTVNEETFQRAPLVRSLTTPSLSTGTGDPSEARAQLAGFLASPWMQRLHGFHAVRPTYTADYGDDVWLQNSYAAEAFASAKEALRHLRAFGSDDAIGAKTMRELGVFGRVERLWHHEEGATKDIAALVSQLPLVELDLGFGAHAGVVGHLPATLRSLQMRTSGGTSWDDTLTRLVASPCARSLERLAIHRGRLADGSLLARLPRLRSLDLRDVQLAGKLAAPMPALRELRPFGNLTPVTLRPIVEQLGPQLELLDLRGCGELRTVGDAIDATVAGDVRYGMVPAGEPLLLADGDAPEPWWDDATINL